MSAVVFDPRICELGEGAFWHPLRRQAFWFDIHGRRLLSQEDGRDLQWGFDEQASAMGWIDGDMISYTAKWKSGAADCTSITSWTGYFRDGRLAVEWVLVYHDAAEGRPRVRTGTDFYKRN